MTVYLIRYQIRRKEAVAVHQGDWLDKEKVVIGGDDARGVISEVVGNLHNKDFRLKSVETIREVDIITNS